MRRLRMPVLGLMTLLSTVGLAAMGAAPGWAQAPQPVPAAPARGTALPPPSMRPAPAVPTPAAPTPATAAPAAVASRLDVNSATDAQLQDLPGIGPVRAKAIVAGRPYADIKDLETKKVLTAGVLAGIRNRIALANINTSDAAGLQRTLPGIGDVRAKAIVAGRPYASPADLVTKKVLTQGQLDAIKDLVAY